MGYIEELRKLIGHRPVIFVGAVVLVVHNEQEILLQQRQHPYGVWGLPGGLMELGESVEETAMREVYEETGLIVSSLQLVGVFSGEEYFIEAANGDQFFVVTVAYSTTQFSGHPQVNDAESLDIRFFPLDNLPDNMATTHTKIIDRYTDA